MSTESAAGGPAQRIASGYAVAGQALELGTVVVDGAADPTAQVRIPLATINRHGWWPEQPEPGRPKPCN